MLFPHLAKRPRGDIDEVQSGRGMALEVRVQLPQLHEVRGGEEAGLSPGGVQDGGGVALGQHEAVIGGTLWLGDAVSVTRKRKKK